MEPEMAIGTDEHVHSARNWTDCAGKVCGKAIGNILDAQRRADAIGLSREAVKAALKDLDEAKEHLMRALVHYAMAEEKSDG
jgi:hypothetical protein